MIFEEFLFFAICFIAMAVCLFYRLIKGPSAADRAVTADCLDVFTDMALVLFALYSGRSVFLDLALITAMLGFLGSVITSRYLEGRL